MKQITINQPNEVVFGEGSLSGFPAWLLKKGIKNLLIVIAPPLLEIISEIVDKIRQAGILVTIDISVIKEPSFSDAERILSLLEKVRIDCVTGIGGGSVMDISKVVAAKINNQQSLHEITGIGNLQGRSVNLVCIPTTSGTGSEASPNAILIDETDNKKKGIISPFLVPDAVFIDPFLTLNLSPRLTAETGFDALCHCIEAYTNKFSHPYVDVFALEGIRLIWSSLKCAVSDGSNMEARANLCLGSYFGGLCLGPVNTSAIHALSYPLGGEHHIPHGLANAILLPAVFEFNAEVAPKRHAMIAAAMGIEVSLPDSEKINIAVSEIKKLLVFCGIPDKLSDLGIDKTAINSLATSALTIERLLKNNPREVTFENAISIYRKLL